MHPGLFQGKKGGETGSGVAASRDSAQKVNKFKDTGLAKPLKYPQTGCGRPDSASGEGKTHESAPHRDVALFSLPAYAPFNPLSSICNQFKLFGAHALQIKELGVHISSI